MRLTPENNLVIDWETPESPEKLKIFNETMRAGSAGQKAIYVLVSLKEGRVGRKS
jgi:hypothetical protein